MEEGDRKGGDGNMSGINLMPHQIDVLQKTEGKNRVAYYLD